MDGLVEIATFINPHIFWIIYENDKEDRRKLEELLQERRNSFKEAHITEKLALVEDKQIWKRILIKSFNNDLNKYEGWLIDYGKNLVAEVVYELPKEFMRQPAIAQSACLYNTIPLKSVLDVEQNRCIYQKQIHFSEGTIKVVKDYIQNGNLATFHVENVYDNVLCGSLYLTINETNINIIDMLVEKGHVTKDPELFFQAMKVNFEKILENDISFMLKHNENAVNEGIGRGCLRILKRDTASSALNSRTHVPKLLLQKQPKAEHTATGKPSRLFNVNDELLEKSYVSTFSNSDNKDDLMTRLQEKNEYRIPSKQQTVIYPRDNEDLSIKSKSRLSPSAIKNLLQNKKGIKDTITSLSNINEMTPPEAINFKIVQKGGRQPILVNNKNENHMNNRLFPDRSLRAGIVGPIHKTFEIKAIMRGRGKSKVFVPKNETTDTPDEDKGSREDIDKSNTNSQDITDSFAIKSSEDLDSDQISKLSRSSTLSASSSERSDRGNSLLPPESDPNSSENEVEASLECCTLRKKFKFGCQCKNCLKWETNDFAEEDKQFADLLPRPSKAACQPPPFFKGESTYVLEIQMKKIERSQTKIQKDIAPCLLVHSLQLPRYTPNVADVAFCQSVHRALNRLQLRDVYTIQSYAWPAVMRSMNVCLVGAPQSGKSLCYVPAICTFVIEKESRYYELPKKNSPVALIICESAYKAEEIYNLFISILKYTLEKVAIALCIPPFTYNYLKYIKSCDILIATPRSVINLLKSRHVNLKRLCHFVVEDADKLLAKYANEFETLTKVIESMLNHRVCFHGVQVITISEHWTRNLETFLKRLDSVPIICIGSDLQCAIYAQANIQMHFASSSVKIRSICDIVKEHSRTSKTIIVCNDDFDVNYISKVLQIEGSSVTSVTSNMMADDILEQELLWNSTSCGRHSILVCTDSTLKIHLSVTQAEMLIHYSLPQDHWTDFSRRFKCLLDNYDSPLNSKSDNSCRIHIYVSEDCSKQYPRLYRFLTDMGITLPPKFVEFSMNMELEEEQVKIENNSPLCKRLKLLGKCTKFRCNKRHMLNEKLDLQNWIPTAGTIKFQLLSIQDGSLFGVRLLEHIDTNYNIYKIDDHTQFIRYDLTRDIRNNKISATIVSIGELYAWLDAEMDVYHRCKVLKFCNKFKITQEPGEVLVKLIDIGKEKRVQTGNLYKLPNRYTNLPPQSVDVYLANILPLDKDEYWCTRTKNQVLDIMNSVDCTRERCYFTGRILLQIGEALWLDDIKLQEDLEYSNEVVTIFSLKKKMLERQLCSNRKEQLEDLYAVCKTCNITLPNYEHKSVPKVQMVKQTEPQWAYLENDYNIVHFCSADSPSKFYVRQEKYQKLFQQLQREIQEIILKPFYPQNKDISINNCYLAQDPSSDEYGRVIVKNIRDNMADCFFVDFGDSTIVQTNELKFLPDDMITRLPFQAIECSLFGVKPVLDFWAYEATDVLYDHCFEINSNIYKNLYVKYFKSTRSRDGGRNVYSVVLLDYVFEKSVSINTVLIDCGFASMIKEEILTNLTLPDIKKKSKEIDSNVSTPMLLTNQKDADEDEDIWDVQINDAYKFMDEWFGKNTVDNKNSAKRDRLTSTPNYSKSTRALPAVSYCTPDVVWYQTDHLIKFDIILPDVEKYTATILKKNIFSFSTTKNGKEYKLNFQLFEFVNPTFQHTGGGPVVRVSLTKATPVEWDRLTFSNKKMRNIKYNVLKCVFPEEKRLFLDIERDEEEEADNTDIVVDIGSDDDYSESDIETDFESD
ncbi:hypothetical protein Trydic_g12893 [Trypoxylus dichotomus]